MPAEEPDDETASKRKRKSFNPLRLAPILLNKDKPAEVVPVEADEDELPIEVKGSNDLYFLHKLPNQHIFEKFSEEVSLSCEEKWKRMSKIEQNNYIAEVKRNIEKFKRSDGTFDMAGFETYTKSLIIECMAVVTIEGENLSVIILEIPYVLIFILL